MKSNCELIILSYFLDQKSASEQILVIFDEIITWTHNHSQCFFPVIIVCWWNLPANKGSTVGGSCCPPPKKLIFLSYWTMPWIKRIITWIVMLACLHRWCFQLLSVVTSIYVFVHVNCSFILLALLVSWWLPYRLLCFMLVVCFTHIP